MAFEAHLRWSWRVLRPRIRLGRPWIEGPYAGVWWLVLLRALLAIAAGSAAIAWPHPTLVVLVRAFGVFALLEGSLAVVVSSLRRRSSARAWAALGAVTSVAAGVAALTQPARLAAVLVMAAGAWLIIRGAVASCEGFVARRERRQEAAGRHTPPITRKELCLIIDGAMSGIFGLAMFIAPHLGAFGLMLGLGAWAVLHGVLMITFAMELRSADALISALDPDESDVSAPDFGELPGGDLRAVPPQPPGQVARPVRDHRVQRRA